MSRRPAPETASLGFAAIVVATLVTFRALDLLTSRLGQLPATAYSERVFLDNVVTRWWHLLASRVPWWLSAASVALFVTAVVVDRRYLRAAMWQRVRATFAGWHVIEHGRELRWLVAGVTGIATWALSSYATNLYFGELHVVDRLVIIALWIAMIWRPIFALPYAIAAAAIAGQFVVPLGFITWTEMELILRFAVLVGAFWIVRAVTDDRRGAVLIFAWYCLLASAYWTSGLDKVRVGWLSHPHLHLLMVGAYANGWLSFLDPSAIARAARTIAVVASGMMVFTLVVECGSPLILWRRWSLIAFSALASAFHLSVFAMTGIFLWKWMLVHGLMIAFVLAVHRRGGFPVFGRATLALSALVIVASPLWAPAPSLTWFDTPLTYTLEFEAVDARGATHALPAGFFRPYSDAIVLVPAAATPPHPKLTRGMGVTMDRSIADALEAVRSPDAVFALEQTHGTVRSDSAASAAFDDFLRAYASGARCASERDPLILRIAGVPRHLWTFPLDASLPCGVPIERVRVHERTVFFDGSNVRTIRRVLLRDIAVPPRGATATR